MQIYFDNASTTMVRSEVIDIMTQTMCEDYGNPSSMHAFGRRAELILERARNNISEALGVKPKFIYFTSSGTEANNLALLSVLRNRSLQQKGKHIITSLTEHDSLLKPIKKLEEEGFDVTYLEPDIAGRITVDSFAEALREDTVFASLMYVNNETGAVNPIADYAKEIKRCGFNTLLHTDAVQGFCKLRFTARQLGVDLITVSAHKLHGPKGVGALYAGERVKLSPIIVGGGQEHGIRAGTEALPSIAGFGEAVRFEHAAMSAVMEKIQKLRDFAVDSLQSNIPDIEIIGNGDCPSILCISLPGFKSEVLLNYLDSNGICVSKGSACKKGMRSSVLEAMKLPDKVIDGALRISFSNYNNTEEITSFVGVLKKAHETLHR